MLVPGEIRDRLIIGVVVLLLGRGILLLRTNGVGENPMRSRQSTEYVWRMDVSAESSLAIG